MSKELIERLRVFAGDPVLGSVADEAADALEVQQSELRVKDLTIGQMANDMAAAQAQLKDMRECVLHIIAGVPLSESLRELCLDVIDQPTDTTALRKMLKAERERCAKVCDEIHSFHFAANPAELCAINIRAMGSE